MKKKKKKKNSKKKKKKKIDTFFATKISLNIFIQICE